MKKIILPTVTFFVILIGLSYAYAEEVTVDVPFAPDDEKQCTYVYDVTDNKFRFLCIWEMTPTDEEIVIIAEGDPELVPENVVDKIIQSQEEEISKAIAEPIIRTEQIEKAEGIKSAQEQLESYWKGTETVDELCFGGTVRESRIFQEFETIDIKRPNDNIPLSTNQQFKYEHVLSEICKAEYTLKYKVHNALKTPQGTGGTEYTVTATLPEDVQAKYDEAKMGDFFAQQSIQFAEEFQCSILGKQQGHCIKEVTDQPIPEPESFISSQGKAIKNAYNAYLETGIADIPAQEQMKKMTPLDIIKQYMRAYDIKASDLED